MDGLFCDLRVCYLLSLLLNNVIIDASAHVIVTVIRRCLCLSNLASDDLHLCLSQHSCQGITRALRMPRAMLPTGDIRRASLFLVTSTGIAERRWCVTATLKTCIGFAYVVVGPDVAQKKKGIGTHSKHQSFHKRLSRW